jgi:hypothetical protein
MTRKREKNGEKLVESTKEEQTYMSKPTRGVFSSKDVLANPFTPPAGPERMARWPEKESAPSSPPSLFIKSTLTLESNPAKKDDTKRWI